MAGELPRNPASTDQLFQAPPNLRDLAAGHGTFAAGVLQQVAPTADILAYQAVATDGIGSDIEVSTAVLKAAQDGAKLVNPSLGTETDTGVRPVAMLVALQILAEGGPPTCSLSPRRATPAAGAPAGRPRSRRSSRWRA